MNRTNLLFELARRRKTVRQFSDKPINLNDVIYAVNVAKEAPSGANRQPWVFILVEDEEKKKYVREVCEEVEKKIS